MTIVDTSARAMGSGRGDGAAFAPLVRRRSLPHVLLGAVLVVAAALAAAVVMSRLDSRVPVVAVARAVAAGQVLVRADLTVARIVPDDVVRTVAGGQMESLVGRTAAVPLVAGALLAPDQVGPVVWPPPGEAVIAVAVKQGRAPAGLAEGSRVSVLVLPPSTAATAVTGGASPPRVTRAEATVVTVRGSDEQPGTTVMSLLLADEAATRIASATGEVVLVLRAAGS